MIFYEVFFIACLAILARILIQNKNFTLPTMYKEGNTVHFNWGSFGVIAIGLMTVFMSGYLDASILDNPISIFSVVYTLPAITDAIATKAIPDDFEHEMIKNIEGE